MKLRLRRECNRRAFVGMGLKGLALASIPPCLACTPAPRAWAAAATEWPDIDAIVRPETLFAGIRKPIKARAELEPRIELLAKACKGKITGPLTHIFRFDTPVDGYDSEIGYPVSSAVEGDGITTHTLRKMSFFTIEHNGADDGIPQTRRHIYEHMNRVGLAPELELVEEYLHRDRAHPESSRTRILGSYLAWPEVYKEQLVRVLGPQAAAPIWKGGEKLTPHTLVDPRAAWVGTTLERLKKVTTVDQQFDILSRVALVRPTEDTAHYKGIFDRNGDLREVLRAQESDLKARSGKTYPDPWRFDGKILHLSKVPYRHEAYAVATSHVEKRKAYCFCSLVREAEDPKIDPIFCYRAAGWSRQFFEPIIGREFKRCIITRSILKGDDFCAWDYHLG